MKRQILVGVIGLAFAGCARTWPARPMSGTGSQVPPVASPPLLKSDAASGGASPKVEPVPFHSENEPARANLGAAPVSSPAAPVQDTAISKVTDPAVAPMPSVIRGLDPASVRVPATSSDPLLGAEPDVVPLPAAASPQNAAPGTLPPAAAPPAAGAGAGAY